MKTENGVHLLRLAWTEAFLRRAKPNSPILDCQNLVMDTNDMKLLPGLIALFSQYKCLDLHALLTQCIKWVNHNPLTFTGNDTPFGYVVSNFPQLLSSYFNRYTTFIEPKDCAMILHYNILTAEDLCKRLLPYFVQQRYGSASPPLAQLSFLKEHCEVSSVVCEAVFELAVALLPSNPDVAVFLGRLSSRKMQDEKSNSRNRELWMAGDFVRLLDHIRESKTLLVSNKLLLET